MKKRIFTPILLLFLSAVIFSGCMHIPSGLTDSATPVLPEGYKILGHATGESQYVSILSIIPLDTPDYEAAIQDAIKKYPEGKALINVRSYATIITLIVVNIHKLTVEGDVITY